MKDDFFPYIPWRVDPLGREFQKDGSTARVEGTEEGVLLSMKGKANVKLQKFYYNKKIWVIESKKKSNSANIFWNNILGRKFIFLG